MKFWLAAALLAPSLATAQATQVLPLDTKSSVLTWTGHAEVGSYAPSGGLTLRDGQVTLRQHRFAGAMLTVDVKSMTQSNAALLHHLQGPDFFDTEHFPDAVIRIDRYQDGKVYGTMTLKGKTAPLEAPVRISNEAGHFLIDGKATLDRTLYGITYNSKSFFSGLRDKAIRNTFEVEFALKGEGTLPEPDQL